MKKAAIYARVSTPDQHLQLLANFVTGESPVPRRSAPVWNRS
jgi:hypothetical protein